MPYGDFSLDPFAERPNTARVLMQQGRVLLDSDWNAQVAASTSMLRQLAKALLGPWAAEGDAFKITGSGDAMTVAPGTMWVGGLPCTNEASVTYAAQPAYRQLDALPPALPASALLYLDVWEQTISVHDDESLREVALGGADTTLRSEIRWAVRAAPLTEEELKMFAGMNAPKAADKAEARRSVEQFLATFFTRFASTITLTAEAAHHDTTDACLVAPDAKYRGLENQLYRVEVLRGTHDAFGNPIEGKPLLVWSRDNGSVAFPIAAASGTSLEVRSLGRDDRTHLRPGALAQVVDRYDHATGKPRPLTSVTEVSDYRNLVTLRDPLGTPRVDLPAILRRWDGGPHEADFTSNEEIEIDLENDIVVTLRSTPDTPPRLRSGDYWIIPARTALGDVIWPREAGQPKPLPPHGVTHHYAPLAAVGGTGTPMDVRTVIRRGVEMV